MGAGSQDAKQGRSSDSRASLLRCFALLGAIALAVVVFRGAYEQIGNTVALWADDGIDRSVGKRFIPMTWFQALGPLLVFALTPLLLARWARLAQRGRDAPPIAKMSIGAAVVGVSYLMIATVTYWCESRGVKASWVWLTAFFLVMTLGEIHILPVGLGLFGRLAPSRLAATTIAAWFLAAFAGNLLAGSLGSLWSRIDHAAFFLLIAAVAGSAALLLRALDGPVRRADETQRAKIAAAQSSGCDELSARISTRGRLPS
jgi:POT family proton-dependent oligopeptide transporter